MRLNNRLLKNRRYLRFLPPLLLPLLLPLLQSPLFAALLLAVASLLLCMLLLPFCFVSIADSWLQHT